MPASVAPHSYDTELPDNHGSLLSIFDRTEALQAARVQLGADAPTHLIQRVSRAHFEHHIAVYAIARLYSMHGVVSGFSVGGAARAAENRSLSEGLERWKTDLPETQGRVILLDEGPLAGADAMPEGEEEEISESFPEVEEPNEGEDATLGRRYLMQVNERKLRYVQRVLLRLHSLYATMHVNRPQFSETWKTQAEAQASLAKCLDSA